MVGCGRIARDVHIPVLRSLPGVAVSAVIDPDPTRCELACRLVPQARPLAALEDLWDSVPTDAVLVAAPTAAHGDLALEVLEHGAHLYLEKPLAAGIAAADAVLRAWNRKTQVAMVGFNYRFHPLWQSARQLLAQGVVGTPLFVSAVFSCATSAAGDWRAQTPGGGVLLDLGSHHVDLVHFLLGRTAIQVHAQTSSAHCDGGTATLQVKLQNNVLVSCSFSYGTVDQDRVEIFGDKAVLRVDRYLSTACEVIPLARQRTRMRQVSAALSFLWRPGAVWDRRASPGHEPSYRAALQSFVQSVVAGRIAEPDLEDGYRALAVIAAAEQSAGKGDWVDVAATGGVA